MQPFTIATGPGVVLARDNIDTDQLIPARFMKRTRSEGYGDQLLYDLRFREDGAPVADFPLNRMAERPALMVAGENFGCGSSREAAVYALVDHGIRAVVAGSFADIFRGNAAKNGLLTIALGEAGRQRLASFIGERVRPGTSPSISRHRRSGRRASRRRDSTSIRASSAGCCSASTSCRRRWRTSGRSPPSRRGIWRERRGWCRMSGR